MEILKIIKHLLSKTGRKLGGWEMTSAQPNADVYLLIKLDPERDPNPCTVSVKPISQFLVNLLFIKKKIPLVPLALA